MQQKFFSVVFKNIFNFGRTYIASITTANFNGPNTSADWFKRLSKPRENKLLLQWWICLTQDLWSFLWLFMIDECLTPVEIMKMSFLLLLVFDLLNWKPVARPLMKTDFDFWLGYSTLFDWANFFSHSAKL